MARFFKQILRAVWYPDTDFGLSFMWLQVLATVALSTVALVLGSLGIDEIPFWFRFVFGSYALFTAVHVMVLARYIWLRCA
ncbi:hypothetical protein [Desulfovirgula thermocuniculi]|uniref:hypothetical protein n=1 Tax=Desulfovirgula thermocuniculi TaxID=348842 RepID=UPI000485121B|nr:hypothetical protein [Desulfovirgula thermocuniculi]